MHQSVRDFVAEEIERHAIGAIGVDRGLRGSALRVLEVGSYDEGGEVRDLFASRWLCQYVGTDMRAGPGVDLVWDATTDPAPVCAHLLGYRADVVVSCEMLEHCLRPAAAVANMGRLLVSPGGLLLLTCRGYETGHMPVHAFPDDFWRFSLAGVRALVEDAGLVVLSLAHDPEMPGVFCTARRPA